jgi:hypothetical protein
MTSDPLLNVESNLANIRANAAKLPKGNENEPLSAHEKHAKASKHQETPEDKSRQKRAMQELISHYSNYSNSAKVRMAFVYKRIPIEIC